MTTPKSLALCHQAAGIANPPRGYCFQISPETFA